MTILSVYIEEGCITCDACEQAAPEVFEVTEDTCFIKSDVRLDGGFDRNDSKSALKKEVIQTLSDDIFDAADGCPVDVIIVVEAQADEDEKEEEAPVVEVEASVDAESADEPLVVEGLDAFLTTGDRTLNVFFGSQSGNSEELAAKLAKNASQYGLEGVVHDMDGFDIKSMASMKRVAIVCSTWGEGEMPDNAEALWQAAVSDGAPRMDGMSFSV
ncbi:MAG: flavodoxin domain-containing protein, partial [Candidatus Thermoplasmatota archaeon]|nr:flavodoxin domain-containing protein [Candidatus Thermoplasmatota archaeon]